MEGVTGEGIDLSSLYPGRQFEINTLGYTPITGYIPPYAEFNDSMWWVVSHQPEDYDFRRPTGGLNEELFELVAERLPKKWRKFLYLFIAVGSSFDQYHGIDAFFYLNGVIVSIDVTTDLSKTGKADFIVTPMN